MPAPFDIHVTPTPAGYCDPGCPGWAPCNVGEDREGIERCDECTRAAGVADAYTDDNAVHDAAAYAVAAFFSHRPPAPYPVAAVVSALRATPAGRQALADAVKGGPPCSWCGLRIARDRKLVSGFNMHAACSNAAHHRDATKGGC